MQSRTLERWELLIIMLEQQVKTMTAHSKLDCMVILVLSGSFLISRIDIFLESGETSEREG